MGTSFGAKISGIVRVDKRYLWLVNGCLEYHRPIITSACSLKRSQTSLRPKLVPILLHVSEVGNLRNLFISLSSIHLSTGLRGLKTTQRQGWRRAEILKLNWPIEDRQNEQRTLLDTERACFASVVFECFTRFFATLCLPKVGKSIWYRFAASNYKHI